MKTAHRPQPDEARQRLRLWLRMLRATRMIEGELRERLRTQCATTMPRFDVLAALYKSDKAGLRMNELSRLLMVSNGNVTGIVDRLVKDQLVLRTVIKDDRRALLVRLTPKGRQQFERMAAQHEGWVSEILSDFDEHEAEELIARLNKFIPEENTR